MKILQLISSGGFYGAESVLLNLSVELQRSGHTCMVGVFENAKNANTEVGARAEIAGLAVRRIPCRSRFDWQTVRQIQKIIEEDGIDLVHAHGYKADFYALLAARLAEVPVTATCHNWLGKSRSMRAYARLDRYLLRFFDGVAAVSRSVATANYDELMPVFNATGRFDAKALDVLARSFVEMGALPERPDMSKLYTEAFLPNN